MELIAKFHDVPRLSHPPKMGAPFNHPKAMTPPIQLRKMRLSALAKGSPRAGYPLPEKLGILEISAIAAPTNDRKEPPSLPGLSLSICLFGGGLGTYGYIRSVYVLLNLTSPENNQHHPWESSRKVATR